MKHTLIRVLEYTFDSEEDLLAFYAGGYNAVPWNGDKSFVTRRSISSFTFRPDLTTFSSDTTLREQVYAGVVSDTIYRADMVVAVKPDGDVQVIKDRTGAQHPTGGFRGLE